MLKKVVLLLATLSLFGCSKITKENYKLLETGMSQNQITAILGEPASCSEAMGAKSCIWGDEKGKHIKVRFAVGAAVVFSHEGLN